MSSAAVQDAQADGPGVDEIIRRTVRALRSARQADAAVMAKHIGISRAALYNRLNGAAPFLAAEVFGLAQFFGVPINDLYEGLVRVQPVSVADGIARVCSQPNEAVVIAFPQVTDGHVVRDGHSFGFADTAVPLSVAGRSGESDTAA